MALTEQIERMLDSLTSAEKSQVLQRVAQDLVDAWPGIESTPDVCDGEARIIDTRIPVWLLEQARRLGTSDADLLSAYLTLRAEDLANAWAYTRTHREEIDQNIRENEEA